MLQQTCKRQRMVFLLQNRQMAPYRLQASLLCQKNRLLLDFKVKCQFLRGLPLSRLLVQPRSSQRAHLRARPFAEEAVLEGLAFRLTSVAEAGAL